MNRTVAFADAVHARVPRPDPDRLDIDADIQRAWDSDMSVDSAVAWITVGLS